MAVFAILFLMLCKATPAQTPSAEQAKKVFTLEQAVDFALKNYPAVRASLERVRAADAGVGLARTNYLPRADVLWQANRATDNNITGLLLPQSIIPPITGPATLSPSNQSAWGSAAGLLFSWEPLDFGYRGAKVDAARATRNRATAEASREEPMSCGRELTLLRNRFQPRRKLGSDEEAIACADSLFANDQMIQEVVRCFSL
ncbi:MAG TPA: TolC family protein [Candidatus Acidoferrum sp.]